MSKVRPYLQKKSLLELEESVLRAVRELTGAPASDVAAETPLMEAGVDSLAATELSSRLRSLTGMALSPTLVFEQPTSRAVAEHLLEQVAGTEVVAMVATKAAEATKAARRVMAREARRRNVSSAA